jgi:hypothetical protein
MLDRKLVRPNITALIKCPRYVRNVETSFMRYGAITIALLSVVVFLRHLSGVSERLDNLEKSKQATELKLKAANEEIEKIRPAANASLEIRNEAEMARQKYEAQLKAAHEAIEKIKADAEKIEKAAEESIKSLSLYRSFINDHRSVLQDFRSKMDSIGNDLEISIESKMDSLVLEFLFECREKDSIISRIGSQEEKRKKYSKELAKVAEKSLNPEFAKYRSDVEGAEKDLFSALYYGPKISRYQNNLPSLMHLFDNFSDFEQELSNSNLIEYLTDPKQTAVAVVDEAIGWIPGVGDFYDLSKLFYDPRYEKLLKPRVLEVKKMLVKATRSSLDKSALKSKQLVKDLEDPSSLHTRATLYAEYSRLVEQ